MENTGNAEWRVKKRGIEWKGGQGKVSGRREWSRECEEWGEWQERKVVPRPE